MLLRSAGLALGVLLPGDGAALSPQSSACRMDLPQQCKVGMALLAGIQAGFGGCSSSSPPGRGAGGAKRLPFPQLAFAVAFPWSEDGRGKPWVTWAGDQALLSSPALACVDLCLGAAPSPRTGVSWSLAAGTVATVPTPRVPCQGLGCSQGRDVPALRTEHRNKVTGFCV